MNAEEMARLQPICAALMALVDAQVSPCANAGDRLAARASLQVALAASGADADDDMSTAIAGMHLWLDQQHQALLEIEEVLL